MKICFLGNASSIHTIKWARYFSEKGHDVHLVSFDLPETDDLRGIKLHILKKAINTIKKPWIFFNMPFTIIQIRKVIKEIKPDIVSAHYLASYGLRAAFSGFHPLASTAWGSDVLLTPKNNYLAKKAVQFVIKKSDIITCDAEHMKKAMIELGAEDSKIKIINFGVDTKIFAPKEKNPEIIKELGIKEGDRTIVSLKWLDPISDIETLLKAAVIVVKKYPNSKFFLIGPTAFPDHLENLKKMAKDLGLEKNVLFIGVLPFEKMPDCIRACEIYVCPSFTDAGLASSTAEAMACEVPVVITDFGDNTFWVKDGVSGMIFKIKDYKKMAEEILYLLGNPQKAKEMGKKGREIIEEKNSYYNEMEKMEKIYQGLIPKKRYQICTKCLMDTSDPEILFDKDGICNHCKDYENQKQYLFTYADLEKIAEKIKSDGKGKKYDCVLAMSGGVDSCMSAYMAKKVGLRPLAIHLDNGWNSEISQTNIERTTKKLGIDLYTHVIDWEEFKDLQKAFLKASVANIDYPYDHAILALFFKMAAKTGVKYIINGANIRTEFIMPKEWGYNSWDSKHLWSIHKRFGQIKKLNTFPSVSLPEIIYHSIRGVRGVRILDYINFDKNEAKEFLKKEFGWQDYGAKHCESVYTKFFLGYVLPNKFGFDRNRAWLSTLILSGQMTREDALKELEKGFYSSKQEMEDDKEYIIKKLGFSKEEFEKIIALPIKNHRDYPNNAFFLDRSGIVIRTARKILRKHKS